jgi:hypothetical protein
MAAAVISSLSSASSGKECSPRILSIDPVSAHRARGSTAWCRLAQRRADPISARNVSPVQESDAADALEEVGGEGAGEGATAQEVVVVAEANAVADAGSEPRSLELPGLDPAANGLLVRANAAI